MIGKTISHYKILEKLGEGGVGVVYKAEDTKLRRTVALKFLRPQAITGDEDKIRFIHEAQAAAALDNPNICTVYEIGETEGQTYISMAYIEGQSLKERIQSGSLELAAALDIAIQAASGLQAAHAKGITHRDIKSANVMITPEGQVKIMDFGLAKTVGATQMTKTGTTLGTAACMSPEQALGQPTDHRTDIWSLGVVLYEMLTGQVPFKGEYDPALMYSIVNESPKPVTSLRADVPLEVEQVVRKALTKDPEKRYQRAEDLIKELNELRENLDLLSKRGRMQLRLMRQRRRIMFGIVAAVAVVALIIAVIRYIPVGTQPIDSIAVLPLENLSGDPNQEYFADGVTEALITELSRIGALRVISRTSAMHYKETDKTLPEIARELDVDAVVAGSVLPAGERVRITAQLIGAVPERHLWSDNYDRDFGDILILSSEVAQAIAREIRIALTPEVEARLASVHSVNPEAHDLYLRGKYHYCKATKEGAEKANEYFQQAIKIDPDYARAYAMLALVYEFLWARGDLPLDEVKAKVETLVKKALEIDDTIAEAHMSLAVIRMRVGWDWVGAEKEFKRAIELNPSLVDARVAYAHHLMAMGRFEESVAEAKHALQLDPVSRMTNMSLAYIYRTTRQYDKAIAQYRRMTELEPNDPRPHTMLAWTYEAMERYEDAVRARKKSMTLWGAPPERIAALDSAYSKSGPKGYWMWLLESLKGLYDRNRCYTAVIYARLGDKDQAFAWLEKAYKEHDRLIYLMKVSPSYDLLRDDPRFQDLLRRMNFPENETQK